VNKLVRYFKKILGLTELEKEVASLRLENGSLGRSLKSIQAKFEDLDKLTRYDVDVGFRGQCSVVLTGVYKGKGYVQYYDIPYQEFEWMVEDMRERRKHNLIRNIDCPLHLRGCFDIKVKGR
jgi:hypothetical protein